MTMTSDIRLLHTMVRVRDLDASLDFYCDKLGMSLLRRMDFPEGKFTLVFLGYGPESQTAALELTHNWDRTEPYEIGTGYGHIALGIPDIYAYCEQLQAKVSKSRALPRL